MKAKINIMCSILVGTWSAAAVSKPTTTEDPDKKQTTHTGRGKT